MHLNNKSYWESYLLEDIDYLIVGGGIVGLTCGIALKSKSPEARVVVLERGNWPSGASIKNAGFACFGSVSELLDDANNHSDHQLIELIRQRSEGLTLLKSIVPEKTMNYKEYGGYEYFLNHQKHLEQECFQAIEWANKLAKEALKTNQEVYSLVENSFGFSGVGSRGILNKYEGQIHTGRLMEALTVKAATSGVQVLGGVRALSHNTKESGVVLQTKDHGTITTKKLLLATNGYTQDYLPEMVTPARAQVLVTEPIPGLKIQGTFHLDQGYYYFRNIDQRILLGGGRNLDFDGETTTSEQTTEKIQDALERMLEDVILPGKKVSIAGRWSGIMGVGDQKKPIIKALGPNVYCGVRLGGMGVAIGAHVGQRLADLASK